MGTITVRPGDTEIKLGQVSLWDQDKAHADADPRWADEGGAFIAGDPAVPDATYHVAATDAVREAIQKGRLVVVDVAAEPPTEEPSGEPGEEQPPADTGSASNDQPPVETPADPPAESPKKGRGKQWASS